MSHKRTDKLTHRQVEALKPKSKPYKISDGKGLYLIVNPNGSKWWRFSYRFGEGADRKQKTLSMGVFPDIGLAEARQKVNEARTDIINGTDPAQERKDQRIKSSGANSFKSISEQWHDEMIRDGEWSDKHAKTVMKSLKHHVYPYIGNKDVADIKVKDFKKIFNIMGDNGTTEMLKRVKQRCNLVLNYAIGEELIENNPVPTIKIRKHNASNYSHIGIEELPQLVKDIKAGTLEPTTKTGLLIALYTFVRTNEIRYARWNEIDFDNAMWTIPAERMKMKRDHMVPLSKQALNLLKELKPITGQYPFVFASYHKPMKQPFSNNAMLFALYRLGYRGKMTVHGFRHLASTKLNELGFDGRHVEKQLSHEDKNEVRGTYNKAEYLPARIKMMQEWADFVDNSHTGKVIPINSKINQPAK